MTTNRSSFDVPTARNSRPLGKTNWVSLSSPEGRTSNAARLSVSRSKSVRVEARSVEGKEEVGARSRSSAPDGKVAWLMGDAGGGGMTDVLDLNVALEPETVE